MKRLAVLVLCVAMMFCLSVTAFAAGDGGSGGEIKVGAIVIGAIIGIIIAVFDILILLLNNKCYPFFLMHFFNYL